MEKIRFGRTGLTVSRSGFGALPIQRVKNFDDAKLILQKAYNNGINFFDTARGYTDSEEKIGYALSHVRRDIIIATKSMATKGEQLTGYLDISLGNLKTDYVDIYQFHNLDFMPQPDGPDGLYNAALEAKKAGKIRFIGITTHKRHIAEPAIKSGLFDTIQYPFSSISIPEDIEIARLSKEYDMGFIAMKAMLGGLIRDIPANFAFIRQFDNVVPIWGIQRELELDDFLTLEKNPPAFSKEMEASIEKDRAELNGAFCRACGYCMPCPVGIPINTAARMSVLLKRMPTELHLTEEWDKNMSLVENCLECGQCKSRCPYKLDTPNLLKANLAEFRKVYAEHKNV